MKPYENHSAADLTAVDWLLRGRIELRCPVAMSAPRACMHSEPAFPGAARATELRRCICAACTAAVQKLGDAGAAVMPQKAQRGRRLPLKAPSDSFTATDRQPPTKAGSSDWQSQLAAPVSFKFCLPSELDPPAEGYTLGAEQSHGIAQANMSMTSLAAICRCAHSFLLRTPLACRPHFAAPADGISQQQRASSRSKAGSAASQVRGVPVPEEGYQITAMLPSNL